jgi:hypothetical protein
MPTYYDDNYGHWDDMDDPDMVAFYHKVQAESVRKRCSCCNRIVKIRPEYAVCNACADAQERGGY